MRVDGTGCPLGNLTALSAIGRGFAHEIGNPIAGALALLQLAARRTREPETREHLANAQDELVRVAHIVHELADFTRLEVPTSVVDVNEVVRAALTLARYANQGLPLTVTFEPSAAVLPLISDRHALIHVLLHLVLRVYEYAEGDGRLHVASESGDCENRIVVESAPGCPLAMALAPCQDGIAAHFDGTIETEVTASGSRATVRIPVVGRQARPKPVRL
ncbi:MAG TPA: histidine kinase dimerization/phospho-acceptor domain-containing protein [Candidatus Binatia bacterium]|jgi:signal transduction histidine kinase